MRTIAELRDIANRARQSEVLSGNFPSMLSCKDVYETFEALAGYMEWFETLAETLEKQRGKQT